MPNAFSLAGVTKQIFVAEDGSADNAGTITSPRTFVDVFAGLLEPGTVVWLREGTYVLPGPNGAHQSCTQDGTEAHPIIYMAYKDEHVIIRGREWIKADSTYLVGLDLRNEDGQLGAIHVYSGKNLRFINNAINGYYNIGIGGWNTGEGHVYYGNLIDSRPLPFGYGMYVQNSLEMHGVKIIHFNILCHNHKVAIGANSYAEYGFISGFDIQHNIFMHNVWGQSVPSSLGLGGGRTSRFHHCTIANNYFYEPYGCPLMFGWWGPSDSVTLEDNYMVSGSDSAHFRRHQHSTKVKGNTFISSGELRLRFDNYDDDEGPGETPQYATFDWDWNTYYLNAAGEFKIRYGQDTFYDLAQWRALTGWDTNSEIIEAEKPTENKIGVLHQTAEYGDPQRTHIVLYNWAGDAIISLTAAELGLNVGNPYKLIDVEDFVDQLWGATPPVLSGTYASGTIDIPVCAENEFKAYILINEGVVRAVGRLEGWDIRRSYVIAKEKITGSHLDFPVLLKVTDNGFKDIAHGGYVAQSGGQDICVTDDTGTVKLDYQRLYHDPETGELILYVRIPDISDADDTTLYIYAGNAACEDQQNKEATWDSNHKLVSHMDDDPDNAHISDSTSNANHGTKKGVNAPTEVTGVIGKGQDFNGSDEDINCGTCDDEVLTANGPLTITTRIHARSIGEYSNGRIVDRSSGATGPYFSITTSNKLRFVGAIDYLRLSAADAITLNVDQTVTVTWDGSLTGTNSHIYGNDGNEVAYSTTNNGTSHGDNSGTNLVIGGRSSFTGSYAFDGINYETHISNSVRSPDWVKTLHVNWDDPITFGTWGGWDAQPIAVIDSILPTPAVQGTDTVAFNGHGTDLAGSIVAWEWSSDLDGVIGTTEDCEVAAADLTVGDHTISYRVQDDDGQWSEMVTGSLTIDAASSQHIPSVWLLPLFGYDDNDVL